MENLMEVFFDVFAALAVILFVALPYYGKKIIKKHLKAKLYELLDSIES